MPDPRPSSGPRLPFALPNPHFMAFAPLDAWARLLVACRFRIPVRYWLRLGAGLFTSTIGTAITLPERLLLAPFFAMRFGRGRPTMHHRPGVLVLLGYYRSGTTHLHYLLSCDRRMFTTRWHQTIAPQGFLLTWIVLRALLVPFVPNKRPQDNMAFGPDWPAEDDFALNNWTLTSSLPGRFVVPEQRARFARFHHLEGLSPRELGLWRRTQAAFTWKLGALSRGRMLLLKTPSHTARVEELTALFGEENVRFIHISRPAPAVLRSNMKMHRSLGAYALQDLRPEEQTREELIEEYVDSERRFLDQAAALPPGRLARIRYQDLVADPIAEVRRAYQEVGLDWSDDFERAANHYLATVRDYRADSNRPPVGDAEPLDPRLEELDRRMGHDHDARATVEPPPALPRAGARWGAIAGAVAGVVFFGLWVLIAITWSDRLDAFVWPVGGAVGMATVRAAGAGSVRLGLWATGLTLAIAAVYAPIGTRLAYGYTGPAMWEALADGYNDTSNYVYLALGLITAYRFASRLQVRPPGVR